MSHWRYSIVALALPLALFACLGCVERKISFTSTPPGALVWLNEREIGRTPCETEIVFFGEFDVRIELDGYEPLVTHRDADGNAWDNPPLDFFAEIWPGKVLSEMKWQFELVKRDDSELALLDRASALRDRSEAESKSHEPTGVEMLESLQEEVEQAPSQAPTPTPSPAPSR
ncbi:MAG: PEGA domain-containing protein [Phycisphaerales bacterium]|nr:PEGA domain-containing protein [Phycisphaerales bacterium]